MKSGCLMYFNYLKKKEKKKRILSVEEIMGDLYTENGGMIISSENIFLR